MTGDPRSSTPFPSTPLSRSGGPPAGAVRLPGPALDPPPQLLLVTLVPPQQLTHPADRKSTRLNSSHANISYAVFCLKKKKLEDEDLQTNDNHSCARIHTHGE